MLFKLLLLFIGVPLVELVILLYLSANVMGWQATLALVVVTGIIGATLARWQGVNVVRRIRQSLERGQVPTNELTDALMIFIAGALLLTPGILTDLFGFSLLTPWCRNWYRGILLGWFQKRFNINTGPFPGQDQQHPEGDRIIDARVISSETEQGEE